LLAQLQHEPEIREDRVREATQRLHRGDYLGEQAAAHTAEAILRDLHG